VAGKVDSQVSQRREARDERVGFSLVAALVVLAIALGLVGGLLLGPLFDESDMGITMVQAGRVLVGQTPYADFIPIYGPAQQYITALFLGALGSTPFAARLCTLCFVLLAATMAFALTRRMGFAIPASLGFATAAVCLLGAELTPQATYMLGPVTLMAVYLVLKHALRWNHPSPFLEAAPLLAGLGTGIALAAKPNIGGALLVGVLAGLAWGVTGRVGRTIAALCCGLPALVPLTNALPLASTIPYVAAPAGLLALALATEQNGRPTRQEVIGALHAGLAYLASAVLVAAAGYHMFLSPEGREGLQEWLGRLARHSGCAVPSELLWPGPLYAKLAALLVGTAAVAFLCRRIRGITPLAASVVAGLALNVVCFAMLMRGFNAMRALALWLPTAMVVVFALLRGARRHERDTLGSCELEGLLPLGTVLLVSAAGPSYASFESNAFMVPALLAAFLLNRWRPGDVRSRLGVRAACMVASVFLAIVVAYVAATMETAAARRTAGWLLATNPAAFRSAYRLLASGRPEAEAESMRRQFRPSGVDGGLPTEVSDALDTIQRGDPEAEVYCLPFPMAPVARPGLRNASREDCWIPGWLTPDAACRDLARLEASACEWVMIRRWRLAYGTWQWVKENHQAQRNQGTGDRMRRDFPMVHQYLEGRSGWQPVIQTDEVELWHRPRGGRGAGTFSPPEK
jgi:hypothetical protein